MARNAGGAAGNFDDLATLPWSRLRCTEIFPGCRLDADVLEAPESWMPAGNSRRLSSRSIVPSRAGIPDDPTLAAKRDECVRRALYALWLPYVSQSGSIRSPEAQYLVEASLRIPKNSPSGRCGTILHGMARCSDSSTSPVS